MAPKKIPKRKAKAKAKAKESSKKRSREVEEEVEEASSKKRSPAEEVEEEVVEEDALPEFFPASHRNEDELIDEEFDKAIDQVMQDETPLADLLPRAVKKGEDPSPVLSPTDVPTFHVESPKPDAERPVRPAHVPPRAVLGRRGVLDGPGWRSLGEKVKMRSLLVMTNDFLQRADTLYRCGGIRLVIAVNRATRRLAEQGGPPAGEQEAFEELAEWLRSRGAYINKAVGLTDSDRDGQRGCVATTEIRVGELLLETRCVSGSKQGTDQQQH
ncbi:unnamed protein product [Durusdinium trenchii]|uniref:Uncharacterized protein n=1 Tax=Durusdinium trenchii TaxID=1381693 RepID=A0ABP0IYR6_9DINO